MGRVLGHKAYVTDYAEIDREMVSFCCRWVNKDVTNYFWASSNNQIKHISFDMSRDTYN